MKNFQKPASLLTVSETTNYRLPTEIGERLGKLLTKAGDGSPVSKMMARLLLETIDQIESEGTQIAATPTVRRLRGQLGLTQHAPQVDEAVSKLDEITAALRQMQARLDQVAGEKDRSPKESTRTPRRADQEDPQRTRKTA